jgi:hypothetical protein
VDEEGIRADLVIAGVTLIGPPPTRIFEYEEEANDPLFDSLNSQLWTTTSTSIRSIGAGQVIWGYSLQDVVNMDKLEPDLKIIEDPATAALPESVMGGLLGDVVLNKNYTSGNATHADTLFSSGLLGPVKVGH